MTVVKVLKDSKKSVISLVENEETGEVFIEKVLTCPIDAYLKLQQIKSPYLPDIYLVEERQGKTYVLEEYVGERTLNTIKPTKAQKNQWIEEIFLGLQLLHEHKLLHRDVKPSNLILGEDGHIRLIDFDAVREETVEKSSDTRLLGTQGYAPPEQYGFSSTDVRADIYALGVTMKDLLGNSWKQHQNRHIIEKCTKFSPKKRYSSVKQLQLAWKLRYLTSLSTVLVPLLLITSLGFSLTKIQRTEMQRTQVTDSQEFSEIHPLSTLNSMVYYASQEDTDSNFLQIDSDDFQGLHLELQQIQQEFYSKLYYTKQGEGFASLCHFKGDSLLSVKETGENSYEITFDQRGKGRLQENYDSVAILQFSVNPLGELFFTLEEDGVQTINHMSLKTSDTWRNGEFLYYNMGLSMTEDPLDGKTEVHPFQIIKTFGQSLYQTWRNDTEVRTLSAGDVHLLTCSPHLLNGITFTYYEKDDLNTIHTAHSPMFVRDIYLDDVHYVKFSEYLP